MLDLWLLDVTLTDPERDLRAWCPLDFIVEEGQETSPLEGAGVLVGLTVVADRPPGSGVAVGVFHPDGQEAVERWCADNKDYIDRVMKEVRNEHTC